MEKREKKKKKAAVFYTVYTPGEFTHVHGLCILRRGHACLQFWFSYAWFYIIYGLGLVFCPLSPILIECLVQALGRCRALYTREMCSDDTDNGADTLHENKGQDPLDNGVFPTV